MAGIAATKMKRKDLDEVYDEFSEFSLSSPARKIRRLDAELPPIMEEGEQPPAVPFTFEQAIPQPPAVLFTFEQAIPDPNVTEPMMTEAVPDTPLNDERALVLYKPVGSSSFIHSNPSNVWIKVNPDIFSGLKDGNIWPRSSNMVAEGEGRMVDRPIPDNSLAVVPWRAPLTAELIRDAELRGGDAMEATTTAMDAEMEEGALMEVEEDKGHEASVGVGGEGARQHWMTPQFPPTNTSTPIMGSW